MKVKYEFDFEDVSVYANVVDLIMRYAESGSTHIDLGCGHAAIARALMDRGINYVGFDGDLETITSLRGRGLAAYHIDLNSTTNTIEQIIAISSVCQVDSISMIDVVEHLDKARELLSQIAVQLKDAANPILILSVPNFAHEDVSTKLVSGIWDYTETGILDRTHRVVYTQENLRKLTTSAGWKEVAALDYRLELTEQRLLPAPAHYRATGGMDSLIRTIKRYVDRNYNVYQFVRAFEVSDKSHQVLSPPPVLSLIVTTNSDFRSVHAIFRNECWGSPSDHRVQIICATQSLAIDLDIDSPRIDIQYVALDAGIEEVITGRYVLHFKSEAMWSSDEFLNLIEALICKQPEGVICPRMHQTDGEPNSLWLELARQLNVDLINRCLLPVDYFVNYKEPIYFQDDASLRAQQLLRVAARTGITFLSDIGKPPPSSQSLPQTWQLIQQIGPTEAYQLFILNGKLPEGFINCVKALDAAVQNVGLMRSSISWRATAPIRLIGHIARGNFGLASLLIGHAISRAVGKLPLRLVKTLRRGREFILNLTGILPNSSANLPAISTMIDDRCERTRNPIDLDPMCPPIPSNWPALDIGVVTFNSKAWIGAFVDSLLKLDYPAKLLSIHFIDNNSSDGTENFLRETLPILHGAGFAAEVISRPNKGFGAGHNAAISSGHAEFCLVTNIDLTFEPDSLKKVVAIALADDPLAAAWELRQKPYEHPKFYDPITGTTNWNSHACVLLRRTAVEEIGGYDETLFMYAEDVELSYRLRRNGHLLRYCPVAFVWHYSYVSSTEIKPLQYSGSTFGNLYLRLKYGKLSDILVVPMLALRLLAVPEVFPGSRRKVARNLLRLLFVAPKALLTRKASSAHFPFRTWDYELIREGAFVEQIMQEAKQPLISIVTRTYRGRELYLRQALMSSAHQTWSNLEHIVVEDGGDTMRSLCEEVAKATGRTIRFIANGKDGRSKAGNTGLAAARGRWCVFLDDDDLLFADHVEVLASAVAGDCEAVASYTLALEVVTDSTELAQGRYVETAYFIPAVMRQPFDYQTLLHHNYFAIQSVLFERRLFEERGGFDEDMDALEDWLLWMRYAKGNRFVYVPKVTSMYRTPADPAKAEERSEAFGKAYPLALARAQAYNTKNIRTNLSAEDMSPYFNRPE